MAHCTGFVQPILDFNMSTLHSRYETAIIGAHVESGRVLANDKQNTQAHSLQMFLWWLLKSD